MAALRISRIGGRRCGRIVIKKQLCVHVLIQRKAAQIHPAN
jgi:hypothetical protein